ncbi:hypothetical protein MMC20_001980 [Loxospora ochrophaea]|nr:hypothetical protein [Loxospora ochrophaea]
MASATVKLPVFISGAGPTGLLLALWLNSFQVPYRIVDKAPTTGTTTRAIVIHARTLEFYRQLGIADEVVQLGVQIQGFSLFHNRSQKGIIHLTDNGKGLSKFPFVLSIPQDLHEALLQRVLEERGGKVERGVEVTNLVEKEGKVEVKMKDMHGAEEAFLSSYVAGCDGAHSAVRAAIGVKMEGGTYDRSLFVADVDAGNVSLSEQNLNMCLSTEDFCMMIPLHGTGRARLIGFVPERLQKSDHVSFDDVAPAVNRNVPIHVDKVNWFSHYRVHHRHAANFRKGNVFLLGDAAHLHSPVGGQGMNTGLGDATNLAWKIAAVHKEGAPSELLETYEVERIAFAIKLVNTTDYVFSLITGQSFLGRFLRNWMLPSVFPFLIARLKVAPKIFRRTSQIEIEYRSSALSQESGKGSGTAKAGDRLPWIEYTGDKNTSEDNFKTLESAVWQAHVYGDEPSAVREMLQKNKIPLRVYPWSAQADSAGLVQNVLYLLRPDGHIGFMMFLASDQQKEGQDALHRYLGHWKTGLST